MIDVWVNKAGPDEPEYRTLHRIADGLVPNITRGFLAAVATFAGRIVLGQVERAMFRGDVGSAESAIPWDQLSPDFDPLADVIRSGVERAGEASIQHLPKRISLGLKFDLLNPRAVEFIRVHSGELIREISDETRAAAGRDPASL